MEFTSNHFTTKQVAQMLHISERTVRLWIETGKLRSCRPGKKYLIPMQAIHDLLSENEY